MKLILLLLLSAPVMANNNCTDLDKFKLGLNIHASNWANAITTRTPDGGSYKLKTLDCSKRCKVIEKDKLCVVLTCGTKWEISS
jgi:flagellar basal body rod protein FlgC